MKWLSRNSVFLSFHFIFQCFSILEIFFCSNQIFYHSFFLIVAVFFSFLKCLLRIFFKHGWMLVQYPALGQWLNLAHKTDDTIVLSQSEMTLVIGLSIVLLARIPEIWVRILVSNPLVRKSSINRDKQGPGSSSYFTKYTNLHQFGNYYRPLHRQPLWSVFCTKVK